MTNCESCGRVIPDNAVVCPNCGAVTSASWSQPQPPSYTPPQQGYMPPQQGYMPPQQGYMPPQQGYMPPQQGYMPPQQGFMPPQQQGYMPPQQGFMPPQQQGYMPPQQYPNPSYQQGVNVTVINNPGQNKSSTPVLVEVLLSLFLGIYGVGWLMAGETTPGVILLICSFVVYWPLVIMIAVFTLGFGLFCDVPMAIGAIILNAVLLNNTLNRKATY